jgi:hypothetical protein
MVCISLFCTCFQSGILSQFYGIEFFVDIKQDGRVADLEAAVGSTSLLVTVVPNNQNAKYSGGSAGARPLPPDQLKCNILKGTCLCSAVACLCLSRWLWAVCVHMLHGGVCVVSEGEISDYLRIVSILSCFVIFLSSC